MTNETMQASEPPAHKMPKRVGHLHEKMCEEELIRKAIKKASKGKHDKRGVRRVLNNEDFYVRLIQQRVKSCELHLTDNHQMTRYDRSCNKVRLITVPKFIPDQIIHWVIILVIEPVLKRGMYRYTCGSVPERGGLDAKNYVERVLHDPQARYVMKLDFHHFFPSVDTKKLMGKLKEKIKDKKALELLRQVLENGGAGLPIGYYTSQWLSNFYLEEYDHFVKEKLKVPHYVRYVDDTVYLHRNKRQLRKALVAIREYLPQFNLSLKDNYQIWKVDSRPIDFVGFTFRRENLLKTKEQKRAAAEMAKPRLAPDDKPMFVREVPKFVVKVELRKKIYYRLCRHIRTIEKLGAAVLAQIRGLLSLYGWLKHINGHSFYREYIYDIAPKQRLCRFVGKCDRLHIPDADTRNRLPCLRKTRQMSTAVRQVA